MLLIALGDIHTHFYFPDMKFHETRHALICDQYLFILIIMTSFVLFLIKENVRMEISLQFNHLKQNFSKVCFKNY